VVGRGRSAQLLDEPVRHPEVGRGEAFREASKESDAVDSLVAIVCGGGLATVAPEAAAPRGELKAVQLSPPIAERTVSVLLRRDA
jgi:hypothetical protein